MLPGRSPLGNIVGVYINGASGNQVGGTIPGSANVISGNSSVGVEIYGSGSTANLIQGNIIGLADDGRSAFRGSDGSFVQSVGVFIQAASGNLIGGSVAGPGNVISGNESAGVFILSLAGTSQAISVQGNFIGSGENGGPGPGNDGYGILLDNAPSNPIGTDGIGRQPVWPQRHCRHPQVFRPSDREPAAGLFEHRHQFTRPPDPKAGSTSATQGFGRPPAASQRRGSRQITALARNLHDHSLSCRRRVESAAPGFSSTRRRSNSDKTSPRNRMAWES